MRILRRREPHADSVPRFQFDSNPDCRRLAAVISYTVTFGGSQEHSLQSLSEVAKREFGDEAVRSVPRIDWQLDHLLGDGLGLWQRAPVPARGDCRRFEPWTPARDVYATSFFTPMPWYLSELAAIADEVA